MITYTFKLKDFDGPLDLLLTLIGKAQIDIRDIFVSEITDQYLDIVRNAPDLDMDEASDFLVMAATLLEIKSRAMLPRPPAVEEEEDPETELIRRLEEYKRFRETAESMKDFEEAAKHVFTKLPEEYPLPPKEVELTGLTLQGLTEAFLRIWQRKPVTDDDPNSNHYAPRNIHRDSHTVQECMLNLLQEMKKRKRMRFEEVFSNAPTREEVVTYFLAVLELLKLGQMHILQTETYGEIELMSGRAKPGELGGDAPAHIPLRKPRKPRQTAPDNQPPDGTEVPGEGERKENETSGRAEPTENERQGGMERLKGENIEPQ